MNQEDGGIQNDNDDDDQKRTGEYETCKIYVWCQGQKRWRGQGKNERKTTEAQDDESLFFDGAYNNAVYECVGIKRRPDTPPPGI